MRHTFRWIACLVGLLVLGGVAGSPADARPLPDDWRSQVTEGLQVASFETQSLDLPGDPLESFSLTVMFRGEAWPLTLTRHSLRGE